MNEKQKKRLIILFIVTALLTAVIGFFLGRSTIEKEIVTNIKYIKGEKITNTIDKPVPYAVEIPADTLSIIQDCIKNGIYSELFPEKIITELVNITHEDTLAIVRDWAIKRLYDEVLLDSDTIGKFEIKMEVQYNRMGKLTYSFTPVHKHIETKIRQVKKFSPFIGAGFSYGTWGDDLSDVLLNLNAGFFIKETYGINFQYNRSTYLNANYFGGSFFYKF